VFGGVIAGAAGFLLRRRGRDAPRSGAGSPGGAGFPGGSPGVANYDTGGPPSDTATPVQVVDASAEPLGIDEDAEVEAAAAEAANIGGPEIDYANAEPDMAAGDAQVQPIGETIDQAGDPSVGERPDPAKPPSGGPAADEGL